ncbi:glycosyltransferase 61 family protein [Burkholderia multivorans]|uniref:glycosyltransferase family 61 protein n=1 Tax=Burkholderia multivorans TaxID=87883 RepID=UPI002B2539F5|nr:glycosyltransferase 61 family protein [Burkholderia multivorans]MEB2486952.1 glycosyltransferase 61 family protein [Burkholderia multivorans]MEB2569508.1 glycosyltransferase 61 family protein [Burkholderia multivorans]
MKLDYIKAMVDKNRVALSSIPQARKELPTVNDVSGGLSSPEDCKVDFPVSLQPNPGLGVFDEVDINEDAEGSGKGGARIFLPERWRNDEFDIDHLSISFLNSPYVFGGKISRRIPGFHFCGQTIITSDGKLIGASYGTMDGNQALPGDILCKDGDGFKYQGPEFAERMPGAYYLIGNVHRHFGHVVLEGLTRLWAVKYFSGDPSIRFAVYEDEMRPFATMLLEFAGVGSEKIVSIPEAAVVEKLIVPDSSMRSHRWITQQQMNVWRNIAESVVGRSPSKPHRKTYLSRKKILDRPLENEAAVENFFADQGFDVISPETMSLQDQIKIANESSILAGPVGSQMYLAAFQQRGTNCFVVAPRNFYLRDDSLISSANEGNLRVCFGSLIDFNRGKQERSWSVDLEKLKKSYIGFLDGIKL